MSKSPYRPGLESLGVDRIPRVSDRSPADENPSSVSGEGRSAR